MLMLLAVVLVLAPSASAEAPTVTITEPLNGSATNSTKPVFGGTTNNLFSFVTLDIYEGVAAAGTLVQTEIVAPLIENLWEVLPSLPLAQGVYTAVAQQGEAPEIRSSNLVTFTVDTTPPAVSLEAVPSPSADAAPTLAGGAGDGPGDHASVDLTIYSGPVVGGPEVQSAEVSTSGSSWSHQLSTLPDGKYTAQVTQRDDAGNIGESEAVTFTIDTTPPLLTIAPVSSPTKDSTPTFTGSAGIASGDAGFVNVIVYQGEGTGGGVAAESSRPVSGGKWSYTPAALSPDGVYTVQAKQSDDAGNKTATAAETFTLDTKAPIVTIEAPAKLLAEATPTLSGSAGTAAEDAASVKVAIYIGSSVGGSPVQSTSVGVVGSAWSYTATKLPDGTYTAQASQEDAAHNLGTSAAVTFTVDTTPPTVTVNAITSPTNDATPTFAGTAGSAGDDLPTVAVTIKQGAAVVQSAEVGVSGGKWSYTPPAELADGSYTVVASQEDEAKNAGKGEAPFTIDTKAPAVSASEVPALTNDSTPTLGGAAGTASGDASTVAVKVKQGATVLQSASVNVTAGKWSYTATKLADGAYTVAVSQEDEAHNVGEAEATFTLDATVPAVTVTPPSTPTKNRTPTLGGAAGTASGDAANVSVKIKQGATTVQSATVPVVAGKWSYTATTLPDGAYTVQAVQEDEAHNVGKAEAPFTIDTVAPAVTVTPPSSPTNSATPTLGGAAGTASGDVATVAVKIKQGATLVQSASVPVVAGKWSYLATKLADGAYTVVASQEDTAKNLGNAEAAFTVDTTAPAVAVTPPSTPTKNPTPVLGGAAGTASGDSANVSVKIKQGATTVQSATVPVVGGTWSYTATTLADGTYTVQVSQEDEAKNVGVSGAATFLIDTKAPLLSSSEVAAATNDSTPTLGGLAGSASGDVPTVAVTIKQGATVLQTASVPVSGGKWSYTATKLADGAYTVVASQEDEAKNLGKAEATFTVDTAAPLVSASEVPALTNDSTPTLGGAAGTASGDAGTVAVKIKQGVTVVQSATVAVTGGKWTYTATKLADGAYTVSATQEDEAHNLGNASASFTVDATPPAVTIGAVTSPTDNPAPALSGTGGVLSGDASSVTVTIYRGTGTGGPVAQSAAVPLSGAAWNDTPSPLAEGVYTVQARQEDSAGNVGLSTAVTFTVDVTAPAVTLRAPISPGNDSTPTFGGAAGVASGDSAKVAVKILQGATVVQSASVEVSGGEWKYTAAKLADGSYTVQASQADSAGNVATGGPLPFAIDTVAPAVTIEPVASPTDDATPKLGGDAGTAPGDHATVVVKIYAGAGVGGTVLEAVSVSASGATWSYTPPSNLADGVYTAQATQGDAAGNVGTSAAVVFTVDTTPPRVSIGAVATPTNDTTPALSGTGGVASGDAAGVQVAVYAGPAASGTALQSATVPVSTGEWKYTATKLDDGIYTAQVSQKDAAGNVGVATVTFTIDTHPPVVELTSPASHIKLSEANPSFSGPAGDASGDEPTVTLRIYRAPSAELVETVIVATSGATWTSGAIPEELENGEYTAQAEQADAAGNIGKSKAVPFKIATLLDLETSTLIARAGVLVSNATPSFQGTAGSGKEDHAVTIRLYSVASGLEVGQRTVARTRARWSSGPMGPLPDGEYRVEATQEGEEDGVQAIFTVDADAPLVTLTSPANGAATSSSSQPVGGLAGGAAGDTPQVTARIYAGTSASGAPLQSVMVASAGGSWAGVFAGLSPGVYTVQAEQVDDVGNVGLSAPATFTVIAPAPAAGPPLSPTASFEWVPAAPHTGEPVTLVSTSTDADSPLTAFAWSLAGNHVFKPGPPVLVTSFATPGVHSVELTVTDALGLSGVVTKKIGVTSPVAKLMQPFPVVRIAGTQHSGSVKVSLLTVLAPVGASVSITCHGRGCPSKSQNVLASAGASKSKGGTALITLRRFERSLPAGVVLEIRVSIRGQIGKFTRFTVRRGKLPSRLDTCLNPAGTTPIACPS